MEARDDAYRLHYGAHALGPQEVLLGTWTASRGTGLLSAGGKLVLTTQRLLYEPMRTPKDVLLGPVAKAFGLGSAGDVLKAGIDATGSLAQWELPVSSIATAEAVDRDRLRVTARSGESWEFGIVAGLWTLAGDERNVAAVEEAVAAIRKVCGSQPVTRWPTPLTSPATGEQDDAFEQTLALRETAMRTGQAVTIASEGPLVAFIAADGSIHGGIFLAGERPNEATNPSNLAGAWLGGGSDAPTDHILLTPTGRIGGQYQLFGALPPLPLIGSWWWVQSTSTLTIDASVEAPLLTDIGVRLVFHCGLPLVVTYIGPTVVVVRLGRDAASALGEDPLRELAVSRVAAG